MHLNTYLLTIIWNSWTGDVVKRKEQKGHNKSTELVLEIKSVLPFLLQEYILRSLLCLCARRQRFRNASFVIFFFKLFCDESLETSLQADSVAPNFIHVRRLRWLWRW